MHQREAAGLAGSLQRQAALEAWQEDAGAKGRAGSSSSNETQAAPDAELLGGFFFFAFNTNKELTILVCSTSLPPPLQEKIPPPNCEVSGNIYEL